VVDQHEVVLERGDLLGPVHGRVAVLLGVQRHDHAGRVLVHAAEGRAAQAPDRRARTEATPSGWPAPRQVRRAMSFSAMFIGRGALGVGRSG
jgi:hypothetical protein